MKFLLTIIFMFTTMTTSSMGAVGFRTQIASDGKCRTDDEKYYVVGESWQNPGACSESFCVEGKSENEVVVRYESCEHHLDSSGCGIKFDYTKDYPGCCEPIYECE